MRANPELPEDIGPLYHGTLSDEAGQKILADGFVVAPVSKPSRAQMAPIPGRVYATRDFSYALIYALGGMTMGTSYRRKDSDRYGWIFELEPNVTNDAVVDEDILGAMVSKGNPLVMGTALQVGNIKKDRSGATLFVRAKYGEAAAQAELGKLIVKHLSSYDMSILLKEAQNVSLTGKVKIKRVWRVDKTRSSEMQHISYDYEKTWQERAREYPIEQVGVEMWEMEYDEKAKSNPAPKAGPSTVRVKRIDGGSDDEKVLESFGDLAVVDRIERRKHHGYKIVHAPTGMLFKRHVLTKPEAVDLARFYGSVPEGMEMLRGVVAGDKEMGRAIGEGEAFKAWQEGKKRKGPVEYKAHYWLRVKKQDPSQPKGMGSTVEENARLDTFEDALALLIGTEIQLNETTGYASLRIMRRTGTKEVHILEHYRTNNDPPWVWMIGGSNEPELRSLPMEALQPPFRPGWKEELEHSVHQLPKGMGGFDASVFEKNPKGREVTPESGANLLKKLYYDRGPIPPDVLMGALDDFRPAMQAAEDVAQSSKMAKQFGERPAEIEWFNETIARLEKHPVIEFLSASQKKTFLGAVQAMKDAFTKAVPASNPATCKCGRSKRNR